MPKRKSSKPTVRSLAKSATNLAGKSASVSAPKKNPVDSFFLDVLITHWDELHAVEQQSKSCHLKINLPCTLADLAAQLATWSFAAVEELAFAAGIEFLPATPLETCGCDLEVHHLCNFHLKERNDADDKIPF